MRPRWYQEQPALAFDLEVDGEGHRHRIMWHGGRLALADHDLQGERVLQALGGDFCPCLLLVNALKDLTAAWPEHSARARMWQRTVTSSPPRKRWAFLPLPGLPGRALMPPPPQARQTMNLLLNDPNFRRLAPDRQRQVLTSFRHQLIQEMAPAEMLALLTKMGRIRSERLAHRPAAPSRSTDIEAKLQTAAAALFEQAMRRSRRDLRPYATLTVEVWKQPAAEGPTVNGSLDSGGGFAAVFLPVRWLNRVWLRGLALVDGHFIADVDAGAPASELQGEAVRWDRQPNGSSLPVLADCSLVRRGLNWELLW
jgi:hypothetical protein